MSISTYAATLHVLSFAIIGNIYWPHDPVFTLQKMSPAALWQAAGEIGKRIEAKLTQKNCQKVVHCQSGVQ